MSSGSTILTPAVRSSRSHQHLRTAGEHFFSQLPSPDLEEADLRQQLSRCHSPRRRPNGDRIPRNRRSRRRSRACAAVYLQLFVALVAEDIGLLPVQLVSELLRECADEGASSYDLIGGLFRQMATENLRRLVDTKVCSISMAGCLKLLSRSS